MLKNRNGIFFLFTQKWHWSVETITFLSSCFLVVCCNFVFWTLITAQKPYMNLHIIFSVFGLASAFVGFYWFIFLWIMHRWTLKWLMPFIFILSAVAAYFVQIFHVYIDHTMLYNVLHTDFRESIEFLQWRMVFYLILLGVIPSVLLWRCEPQKPSLIRRLGAFFSATTLFFGGLWASNYDFGPIIREHGEYIHIFTPLNILHSGVKLYGKTATNNKTLTPIGEDAHIKTARPSAKPRAVVLVIGETVRGDHWGLNHYRRQTTPKLKKKNIINFQHVVSCGTNTAESVPCMFSPFGIHNYNWQRIKHSESLLHVLQRANIDVLWRDNQAGCQGVCNGLPSEKVSCPEGNCYDETLLQTLKKRIVASKKSQIIVLHMRGNHGPAYYQRYPKQFEHWRPTCKTADLAQCSNKALVNTYDNVILYTDTILDRAIDILEDIPTHDTALVYLSDHGESLGEYGLFLHGIPYALAPKAQTHVPMLLWFSDGIRKQLQIQNACLKKKQVNRLSHDHLFSTILGLFEVETQVYNAQYDLLASCRKTDSLG